MTERLLISEVNNYVDPIYTLHVQEYNMCLWQVSRSVVVLVDVPTFKHAARGGILVLVLAPLIGCEVHTAS